MKKLTLVFAFLLACVGLANAQNYVGSYTGLMDEIEMRGNSYDDVSGQVFNLTANMLTGTVSQIGSMPGTISINLPITVDAYGNITAVGTTCGTLTILGFIPITLQLKSLTDATVKNNILEFTLQCHGTYLGADFPASVHFKSESFISGN